MKFIAGVAVASTLLASLLVAQEEKPVPKDSVRVSIPGCTKGYVFTAGPRTENEPGSVDIPNGMHLRMNGPKKIMAELKAYEGSSMVVITGIMKKGQFRDGVNVGGVRIAPGPSPTGGGAPSPTSGQIQIDVEGWRPAAGSCPAR